jgi:hypothetical protein
MPAQQCYNVVMLALCVLLATTTVDVLPLDELHRRSDVVARVKVVGVEETPRARFTTLVIERSFKGEGERVVLFQPLYRGSLVAGGYDFKRGDVRIIFLARHGRFVVQMAPGLGVFKVNGGVREDVGDVVDMMTSRPPLARTFADENAFARALK